MTLTKEREHMTELTMKDRARGLLLGGAIGDALGAIVEFAFSPAELDSALGCAPPEHLPSPLVTDDTQMSLFTAEAVIRTWVHSSTKGIASLDDVTYRAYLRWLRTQQRSEPDERDDDGWLIGHRELWSRRAPGNTCLGSLRSGTYGTVEHRINASKGCGGVMRTAPIGLAYPPDQAYALGCSNAALTHGHDDGIAPAGLLARLIALLASGADLLEAIESTAGFAETQPIAAGTAPLIRTAILLGVREQGFDRDELSRELGEGWVGHEALAIAIACALAHRGDPGRALWVAANHRGDSDSTASIAGQILGAAHGAESLPAEWVEHVELGDVAARLADVLASINEGTSDAEALWADFPGV